MSSTDDVPGSDPMLARIAAELRSVHGCHTVVLYGSRARGEADDSSDYDVVAIRESGQDELHDAREFEGVYLDAFIVSESGLEARGREDAAFIRYRHGIVIIEKGDTGRRLIAGAAERFRAGPPKLSTIERRTLQGWVRKMLARIARGGPDDVEANYRRAWLLYELLEAYFKLRGRWYLGSREALAWLEENDRQAFTLFDQALAPDASRGALRRLAEKVLEAG